MHTSMPPDESEVPLADVRDEIPYMPIFLDLRQRRVLLFGGGAMAAAKARLLVGCRAGVLVVADSLDEGMKTLVEAGEVLWRKGRFEPAMLDGAALVFDGADDPDLTALLRRETRSRGIPLNVIDTPAECDFIVPARLERGPITIAISTGGAAPALARAIRQQLETAIPEGYARLARAARHRREKVKSLLASTRARQRFWDRIFDRRAAAGLASLQEGAIVVRIDAELDRFLSTPEKPTGSVELVGAGPGDPELLTLKAAKAIEGADVIFHDALVSPAILAMARREARLVSVGKRAGRASVDQALTNRMMMVAAQRGERVVRLKGGDPLVFGRAGEEAAYLRSHGIPVSIVSGITAASGIAADLALPLTHRGVARSVRYVTAHCRTAGETDRIDWRSLADPSTTLVVYMGRGQAGRIADALISAGLPPHTAAVAVADGTAAAAQYRFAPVAKLEAAVASLDRHAPVLLIVGDAVAEAPGWPAELRPASSVDDAAMAAG